MTMVAYHVDCTDMFDLTDADERDRLGIAIADLACAWEDLASRGLEPPSWTLAKRLDRRGRGRDHRAKLRRRRRP